MASRYGDDTTVDDLVSGDRLSCLCACGNQTWPAWRKLPKEQQFTPLRDLRRKMVCKRCGARSPTLVIETMQGSGSNLVVDWVYPRGVDVYALRGRRSGP